MAYLDLASFKSYSSMPDEHIDAIELAWPGWIDTQLGLKSIWIDARLRKRYPVPFAAAPATVKGWLADIVTVTAYLRRGLDPSDAQFEEIREARNTALVEIKEAADSQDGYFDLPSDDTVDSSAVTKGGPYVYSEQSPYVNYDIRSERARDEDSNKAGSSNV